MTHIRNRATAGRSLLWRSRAEMTSKYLSDLLADEELNLEEAARLLRAFDFQHDTAIKKAALERLASRHSNQNPVRAFLVAEAILRLDPGKFPAELKATAASALAGSLNVILRAKADKLFPMPPTKDNRPIPQMTDLLVFNGEVDRGREVFTKATCVTCHKAEGQVVDFGPDLSTIGSKLSKLALYEAILNPSSGIATSYESLQVVTESGRTLAGLVVSETDYHLSLKVPGGQIIEVALDEVDERTKLKVSAMPSGLIQLMTLDELIDLVQYLTALKS